MAEVGESGALELFPAEDGDRGSFIQRVAANARAGNDDFLYRSRRLGACVVERREGEDQGERGGGSLCHASGKGSDTPRPDAGRPSPKSREGGGAISAPSKAFDNQAACSDSHINPEVPHRSAGF